MLPAIASRIWSWEGFGFSASSAAACTARRPVRTYVDLQKNFSTREMVEVYRVTDGATLEETSDENDDFLLHYSRRGGFPCNSAAVAAGGTQRSNQAADAPGRR